MIVTLDKCTSKSISFLVTELSNRFNIMKKFKNNVNWHTFPKLFRKLETYLQQDICSNMETGNDSTCSAMGIDSDEKIYLELSERLDIENLHTDRDVYFFVVAEGDFVLPLCHPAVGWGALRLNISIAVVRLVKRDAFGEFYLIGEGEVRTHPCLPAITARDVLLMAAGLVSQGVFDQSPLKYNSEFNIRLPYGSSSYAALLKWITSYVVIAIKCKYDRNMRGVRSQWGIGLVKKDAVDLLGKFPWKQVVWQQPPLNGIAADPFLIEKDGDLWIFYEELSFDRLKGTICTAKIDNKMKITEPVVALSSDYHLSFPHVFEHSGSCYLLPEQSQSGTTMLYKCASFPDSWVEYAELLPGFPGVDPILFHYNDIWWLFVSYGKYPCQDSNLHIFFSKDLEGNYSPHPQNPVKKGLQGSRMAGAIVEHEGRLIRPGQNSQYSYGENILLFEIEELTISSYVEKEINHWLHSNTEPFDKGFHSYSSSSSICAVDGFRYAKTGRSVK